MDPSTVHSLPHAEITQHLSSTNTDIALLYLEGLIDIWGIQTEEVEDSLIILLIEKVNKS